MLTKLLLLAQEAVPGAEPIPDDSAFFNLRNGILAICIIAILIGYKVYKDKAMK